MQSAFDRLMELLDTWDDGQKAKGLKTPPPATILELQYLSQTLKKSGSTVTINETAKDILVKCGFRASVDGVGWLVRQY